MKILTLNTWQKNGPWQERWKVILEGLRRHSPTVAGFQELYDLDWARSVSQKTSYPFLSTADPSSSGLVFMSRLPINASELYTMKHQSPFEDYKRYVLWAETSWKGETVQFFNTHLSWKIEDQATRQVQVRELWEWVKTRQGSSATVLMGDMNATPDSDEIRWFVETSGFKDVFACHHPNEPGFSWDNRNNFAKIHKPPLADRRIDFVFVRGKSLEDRLKDCKLVFTAPTGRGVYASDHYGVLAELAD